MALKNTINLQNISQQDLQTVREITSAHLVMSSKFENYSNQVQDPQLKQMFKQSSTDAKTTATNFTNSL